jgi:predicted RNA-binding Zn-ribbon protein involved in translation (DUF1610 family)
MKSKCEIRAETKLRNGDPNWWCFTHFASARGKNGRRLEKCLKADAPSIADDEKIYIDLDAYLGGVGIWGSLEAVFDSKRETPEKGVHVHLRRKPEAEKEVDKTFKEVYIKVPSGKLSFEEEWIKIDEHTACAYTASVVFGKQMKILRCKHCGKEHIDAEYFAVHYHKKHFCTFCGREFKDTEHGISNPIFHIQQMFKEKLLHRKLTDVDRRLIINQKDYPGGIQIWGSNPAIIWTAQRAEEGGIHVHLFKSETGIPDRDDTFGYVEIDGIVLDDVMIRYFMVQKSLPYLNKYIVSLSCPSCGNDHFDKDDKALNPHKTHECESCAHVFDDKTRFKGVVSNPILQRLKRLEEIRQ